MDPHPARPTPVDQPVADGLRAHRRQLRLTQEEAAAAIGCSLSTYQRWERGEQTPRLRAQRAIATAFDATCHELGQWFGHR
jgi:DNA-binding XRE family transcriptional regulator